jgi:hypothetical protein
MDRSADVCNWGPDVHSQDQAANVFALLFIDRNGGKHTMLPAHTVTDQYCVWQLLFANVCRCLGDCTACCGTELSSHKDSDMQLCSESISCSQTQS